MLNTNILVFLEVAKLGSFTKAGNSLFITSTAVMKHINNLEDNMGFDLFIRSSRGVELTDSGEAFYEDCKKILTISKNAIHRARKLSPTSSIIRLGTSQLTPGKPLINLWNSAYGKFPDYELNLVAFDEGHRTILESLDDLENDFDLLVSPCESKSWLEHISFLPLGNYNVEIAVPRNHPLASKKILKVEDLKDETISILKEGDSPTLDKARQFIIESSPTTLILNTELYDLDTFNYCIKSNSLLLSLDGWREVHPSFVNIPVNWQYQIPYGIAYSKHPSPLIKEFIEVISSIQMSQP